MNTAEMTRIPPTAPPTAPPMTAALTEPAGFVADADAEAEVEVEDDEVDEVELERAEDAVVDGVAIAEVTTAAGIWVVRVLAVRVRHKLSVPDATVYTPATPPSPGASPLLSPSAAAPRILYEYNYQCSSSLPLTPS